MPNQLRIASVSRVMPTPDDPSSGVFVLNRLNAMADIMDLSIVQPVPYFPFAKPLPRWGHVCEDRLQRLPMFYLPKILKSFDAYWLERSVRKYLENLHAIRPLDAIDAHFGFPDGVACQKLGKKLDVPVFVTVRGVENEQLQQPSVAKQLRNSLQNVQGCICVSHFLADIVREAGVEPDKVCVIHNSVDRQLFFPGNLDEYKNKLALDIHRRQIVSVGHLVDRKRHHLLLRAIANLGQEYADVRAVIIGSDAHDKRYANDLYNLAVELGLEEKITFLGAVPPATVADWLRASDVFALFSNREGCCNAIIEALACGIPVVASDVGDNSHFVEEGLNGYIVPVDDVSASTEALRRSLDNSLWNRARISGSLPIGGWEIVAKEVNHFFRNMLSPVTSTDCDADPSKNNAQSTSRIG